MNVFIQNIINNAIDYLMILRITDLIDIAIVAFLMYYLLNWLRERRAMQLIKGIILFLVIWQLSSLANMSALYSILSKLLDFGMISVIVIFQPELRSLLEKIGRSKVGRIIDIVNISQKSSYDIELERCVDEIVIATINMSRTKTGALIVLERETKLGEVMKTGTLINSEISAALLENIFVPNTPLHDGAVIIRDDRIMAAGCFLPLTSNTGLSRELGTRHRAALGISEASDALVIVVSEETGKISLAINGSLTRNLESEPLTKALLKSMRPSQNNNAADKMKFWRGIVK